MSNFDLTDLGLSSDQSQIYLSLLENGPQTASKLASTTPVKRTYVYRLCQELQKLNLISFQTQGQATLFAPLSPSLLQTRLEAKQAQINSAKAVLNGLLPSLEAKYRLLDTKPVVSYFEDIEGIKKVYLDTLQQPPGSEILALVETSKVHPEIYRWVTQTYVKARIKAQISVKAIVTTGSKAKKYTSLNQPELRQTKMIPASHYPFDHEINIYGQKLAIINHNRSNPLLGIIIDHPAIATTFRSWFNLTWNSIS